MRVMLHFEGGFLAASCSPGGNCDEALTYPLSSTDLIAPSGKVAVRNVVRTPIQAQFEPVFGARSDGNGQPQGLEVTGVLIPKMAVTSVHAPVWRGLAGGFGQRQVGSIQGSERRGGTGQAQNLAERKCSGNGVSPQAAALVNGKGTKASADAKARRRKSEGFGRKTDAEPSRSEAGCRRERR